MQRMPARPGESVATIETRRWSSTSIPSSATWN